MDKRVCVSCGFEYPLEETYFGLAHNSTRYLTKCKLCIKHYQYEYRIRQQEESGKTMRAIKEIPDQIKKHNLLKALNYVHLQAFGEQLMEDIYWCKNCDYVRITESLCDKCNKTMEKIGFVDYSEDNK